NATTPTDPAVLDAILPFLREHWGNPSSTHSLGKTAHQAVEQARAEVASLLGAQPDEIVFTGGGSEASNLALKGVVWARIQGLFARWRRGPHLVISAFEHPATAQPCEFLRQLGCKVSVVPVDRQGEVDPAAVARVLKGGATLVSVMHSNNEVGTLQPIK